MIKNLGIMFLITTAMLFCIFYSEDRHNRVPLLGIANVLTFWAICLIRGGGK